MKEAMDLQDWERMDKGLPPLPKKRVIIPEPKFPVIENLLKFKDIPLDRFDKLISARRRTIKNEDGVTFIGMDVIIELKGKRKAGRPLTNKEEEVFESETIRGWMQEGEWYELYRHAREKIDMNKISL